MPSVVSIISAVSKEPEKVYEQLSKIGTFARRYLDEELRSMHAVLLPLVKAELAANYAKSGLGIRTGTLYRATVSGIILQVGTGGFRVLMQAGVKRSDDGNVYGQAGAYKYGGVRGDGLKRLTGSLRKHAKNGHIAGTSIIEKREDFFELDLTSSSQIVEAYAKRMRIALGRLGVIV